MPQTRTVSSTYSHMCPYHVIPAASLAILRPRPNQLFPSHALHACHTSAPVLPTPYRRCARTPILCSRSPLLPWLADCLPVELDSQRGHARFARIRESARIQYFHSRALKKSREQFARMDKSRESCPHLRIFEKRNETTVLPRTCCVLDECPEAGDPNYKRREQCMPDTVVSGS